MWNIGGDDLTGPSDRKAQKNPLRKSVLAALVSDTMQYVFSSGVHCAQHTIDTGLQFVSSYEAHTAIYVCAFT